MRKIIEQVLTEGYSFEKKPCSLSFSSPVLEYETYCHKTVTGSFRILADEKYKPSGYVYSNDLRMLVSNGKFGGLQMEVFFQYDPHGLEPGSVEEGTLFVVSNLGEYEIPYRISILGKYPDSSLGPVKNLFHFANLAKSNWTEAVELFYSNEFEHVLTGNEAQYITVYRGLSAVKGNEQNVENFLVHTRKKVRNRYRTNITKVDMRAPEETVMETITVKREGWGYSDLQVSLQGDFLLSDTERITAADFQDNEATLHYYINHSALHGGKNFGTITISNAFQTMEIPVCIGGRREEKKDKDAGEISGREVTMRLMRAYLAFRTGKMSKGEWTKECNVVIHRLVSREPNHLTYRLYQVQLLLTEKRYEEAASILERIGLMLKEQQAPAQLEGYYYYLCSLHSKDEAKLQELAGKVEYLYVRDKQNWRLAWFLLHMKEEYANNDHKRWELIRQQYAYGNCSPVLYLEALQTMLSTPAVMSEITDFELAFMTFVKRKNVMTREIRNRFVFLSSKVKAFSAEVFELLACCYQMDAKDETLEQICIHLMKGNKIGKEYFKWYAAGVEQEIRVTRLYEYYMMSIDLSYEGKLPKMILMYFAYRSNLDYERLAFLYANILKHKKSYQDIAEEYYPRMEAFVCEQMEKMRMDDNLAYLYRQLIFPKVEDSYYATAYTRLCFLHRIKVNNPRMKNVIVVQEHLKGETVYPLFQGEALFDLPGSRFSVLLEDEEGTRYREPEMYCLTCIMDDEAELEKAIKNADIFPGMALYLAEMAGEKVQVSAENEAALLWLIESDDITENYRREIMLTLLDYYFEKDNMTALEDLLLLFEPEKMKGVEREKCIRVMVSMGMYEKAFEWVRNFGIEYVDYKILLRLCDRLLMRTSYEYEPELVKICEGVFNRGKYDETLLNYLLLYGQSSAKNLKSLWRAADSFGLDVHHLLENMLIQILYTGVEVGEETNLFKAYVAYGATADIEMAFLKFLSYRYLILQKEMETQVFDRVIYLCQLGEEVDICSKLAFVKKCVPDMKKGRLTAEDKGFITSFIREAGRKRIFFKMFLEYRSLLPQLECMTDCCHIEYYGREGSKVMLHYAVDRNSGEEPEYKKEEMTHMLYGVYTKSFLLFYGEQINYYITEEDGRTEKLTRSSVLTKEESMRDAETRYNFVNNVVISHDMQDDVTYCDLSKEYLKKCYMADRLFLQDN